MKLGMTVIKRFDVLVSTPTSYTDAQNEEILQKIKLHLGDALEMASDECMQRYFTQQQNEEIIVDVGDAD